MGHHLVAGAQIDACIRSTIHAAFTRGYDVTLVADAHTTEDQTACGGPPPHQVIAHTNLDWAYQAARGSPPPSWRRATSTSADSLLVRPRQLR